MPIYEYRCPTCGREFEELVSMAAADRAAGCPQCGSLAERRLSMFAVRARGTSGGGSGAGGGSKCAGCRRSSCASC